MWDTFFNWPFTWSVTIPEGYELVEKDEHRIKRLEENIKSLEKQVEWHNKKGADAQKMLEEMKKEAETLALQE